MKLAIVIPAYNEEACIGATVERCLEARNAILQSTPVDAVDIIVVSDGSTDQTEQIARSYEPEVRVVAFPENRGYGAALKKGFSVTDAELLGFLDADGTCDPFQFVTLVNGLLEDGADICVGSRMGPGSKMPFVRRVGNVAYRLLINVLGSTRITDAASGMRVLRRTSLQHLNPLPDGLNFTPAMTCRAVMDPALRITERPIPYEERVGRSKLSIFRDGIRFLKSILNIAVCFRPIRFFLPVGAFFFVLAALYGFPMLFSYLKTHRVQEGMVYRTFAILAFAFSGFSFLGLGVVAERIVRFVHPHNAARSSLTAFLDRALSAKKCLIYSVPPLLGSILALVQPAIGYLTRGVIAQHWSQVALGVFLGLVSAGFLLFGLLGQAVDVLFWHQWNQPKHERIAEPVHQ